MLILLGSLSFVEFANGNSTAAASVYGTEAISSVLEFANGQPALEEGKYTGTQLITSSFGVQRTAVTVSSNRTTIGGAIGSSFAGTGSYWHGNIPEIIVYPTNLNATQTSQVNLVDGNSNFSAGATEIQMTLNNGFWEANVNNHLSTIANIDAINDAATVNQDVSTNIEVLENDILVLPDLSSLLITSPPTNGITIVNPDGTITYTPNLGYTGTDQFNYRICSQEDPLVCDIATVFITVSCMVTTGINHITGKVYYDQDLNGTVAVTEPGAPDVVVELYHDLNDNGKINGTEPLLESQVSDAQGTYQFNIAVPTVSNTVLDQFNSNGSGAGNNGTANWSSAWAESGESNGFGSGSVIVTGNRLRISNSNRSAWRTANLTGAVTAQFSFDFEKSGLDNSDDNVRVQVASSAAGPWTTLEVLTIPNGSGSRSYDISGFISSATTIRFLTASNGSGDYLYFDNVQVAYNTYSTATRSYVVKLASPLPAGLEQSSLPLDYAVSFSVADDSRCSRSFGVINADLSIVKTDAPDPVVAGEDITYTITVTNNGPTNAVNVVVSDILPAGLTLVSATPSTGSWTAPNWTIGALPRGSTRTLVIVAKTNSNLPAGTIISNTATVTSSTPDGNLSNNTCTATTEVICPNLDLVAGAVGQICESATLNLSANGTTITTWAWTGPNGFVSNLQNPVIANVPLDATGTYLVIASNGNGCSETAEVVVEVLAAPVVDAGADTTICINGSSVLTASAMGGSLPYTFTWSGGLGTGDSKIVNPLTSTTYTVTVSSSNGCTDTDQVNIGVQICPEDCYNGLDDDADGMVDGADPDCPCVPQTVSLRINVGSDDAEQSTLLGTVSLTSNDLELGVDGTTSQVVGLRFNGLTIPQGALIFNAYIEFETDVAWNNACNLTIQGQAADNPGTFTTALFNLSTRPKTTNSVAWAPPAWNTVDEKHQSPDLSPIVQEIVNRAGWASGNSIALFLSGTGTREAESYEGEVTAVPTLVVEYTLVTPEICNNGLDDDCNGFTDCADNACAISPPTISDPDTICEGANATLVANGSGTYLWSSGATTPSVTVSPLTTTNYSVTVTAPNGCSASADTDVTVTKCENCTNGIDDDGDGLTDCVDPDCEAPAITGISPVNPSNCPLLNNGQISIAATGANLEYSIDGGISFQASNLFTGLAAGNYYIRIRNSTTGCYVDFAGNPVVISNIACIENCTNGLDDDGDGLVDCADDNCAPVVDAGTPFNSCPGDTVALSVSVTGGIPPFTYLWDHSLGTGQNTSANPLVTTTYHVTVTSASGCTGIDSVTVTILPCPEDCTDGIDNDGDGLFDCDDPDCQAVGQPQLEFDSYVTCPGVVLQEQVIFNDANLQNAVYSIATNPSKGTVSINGNGVFTYDPYGNSCSSDDFVYRVCNDVTGCCDTASVFLHFGDGAPPALANVPADITIGCDDEVPVPPVVYGLDGCPGIFITIDENSEEVGGSSCQNYNITRTWTATDLCGNSNTATQTITVQDVVAPEIFRLYTLPNGRKLIAGVAQKTTHQWKYIQFPINFSEKPLVFSQTASYNDTAAVTIRMRNVSIQGFELKLSEQESSNGIHGAEQVVWMAIEPGVTTDTTNLLAMLATDFNHAWKSITFPNPYSGQAPVFLASIQTTKDSEPVSVRYNNLTQNSVSISLEEEKSKDVETNHANEDLALLALRSGLLRDKESEVFGEAGRVNLTGNWATVNLARKYTKPVVLFGGLENGGDPATIRVRNVTSSSFQVKIKEWDYLDGVHANTTTSYLVVEGSINATNNSYCDGTATNLVPGINLFATDNCDNQVAFEYSEDKSAGPDGLVVARTWSAVDDCGNTAPVNRTDTCSVAAVRLKAFLHGAMLSNGNTGLMRDDLRALGHIPLTEPYSNLPGFQHKGYGGGEAINPQNLAITGPDAVVDWVFLEIREGGAASQVISTKSALLQRDGDVVTVEGDSTFYFLDLNEGDYYVSVRHRNHLGLMSNVVEYLTISSPATLDFRNGSWPVNSNQYAGSNLGNGKRAMWPGDFNGDRRVIFQGPQNDIFQLFSKILSDPGNKDFLANYISTGYLNGDLNMDGKAIYQGPGNDRSLLLFNTILNHPGNSNNLANYICLEKLP